MRKISLWTLAALFIGAGCMHLMKPQPFVQIVPPVIPDAGLMVLLSGIAEIAGGAGILIPRTKIWAGWGLVVLLIAVFPANIYMAARHIQPGGLAIPDVLLWARLPFQPLLIWWVIAESKRPGRPVKVL